MQCSDERGQSGSTLGKKRRYKGTCVVDAASESLRLGFGWGLGWGQQQPKRRQQSRMGAQSQQRCAHSPPQPLQPLRRMNDGF